MFAARLLGYEGDGNAGVGSGGSVVAVSAYMGDIRGSGVLASAERVGWCYVCVCCESGLSVLMAGPGICILC